MSDKFADAGVAQQAELAISRLQAISCLPSSAQYFLSLFDRGQPSTAELARIIRLEPAYAARLFSLLHHSGIDIAALDFSIEQAIAKLPPRSLRDALFAVKIYQPSGDKLDRLTLRVDMVESAIAVASCAHELAPLMSPKVNPDLAYWVGLLHNLGNLALDEAMPRSFDRIIQQAQSQSSSLASVQQKFLAADYTIFGKRLAIQWHIHEQIAEAVWLHRVSPAILAEALPQAAVAITVGLAEKIVHFCRIGTQTNFEQPSSLQDLPLPESITHEQVDQIAAALPQQLQQMTSFVTSDQSVALTSCWQAAGRIAGQLAQENSRLCAESRKFISAAGHLDFIKDFLQSLGSSDSVLQIAEAFAARWQKFYQTGSVFIYLLNPENSDALTGVCVDNKGAGKTAFVTIPQGQSAIQPEIAQNFSLTQPGSDLDWLFQQAGADLDLKKTKLLPLLAGPDAIGVLAFEQRMPGNLDEIGQEFRTVTSIAALTLDMAQKRCRQERLAERFAAASTNTAAPAPRQTPILLQLPAPAAPANHSMTAALAEMAGGAAHELNNPLSVISGRAQLLNDIESDPGKKKMLVQIQENTQKISEIIDDLMSYAEPSPPRPARTALRQVIDDAIQLAAVKQHADNLNIQLDIDSDAGVFVDSAQLASALANILANAIQSYDDPMGPVKISAQPNGSDKMIELRVSDLGRGMDEDIIRKATHPFFSSKPAGRRRGMGLAHAGRLILLNGGNIRIDSSPGKGTTVTISLPQPSPAKS